MKVDELEKIINNAFEDKQNMMRYAGNIINKCENEYLEILEKIGIIPKWPQKDPKMIPMSFQKDPKVIKKWP